MPSSTSSDYYLARTAQLIKGHQKLIAVGNPLLKHRYGETLAATVEADSSVEFEQLIPAIPYIGGRQNPYTDTLVQMTSLLALYRVLKRYGRPVEEIGEVIYRMAEAQVQSYPAILRSLLGRFFMSNLWRRRTEKKAQLSQKRQYEGDFVYQIVPGDGDTFDWGINYLECGVVKFFHEQGADELTPYMCLIDGLLFPGAGVGLQRQGTIAHGCSHCDFRFKYGAATPPAWPPSFWTTSGPDTSG